MSTVRQILTAGNPIAAGRALLQNIWTELDLEAMLLPIKDTKTGDWKVERISNSGDLLKSNPFIPLMTENCAIRINDFQQISPGKKLAVLLRPCVLDAWHTIMPDHQPDPYLITISTDCLGTFPLSEYAWRTDRTGSEDNLFTEYLKFSHLGGISPYRLRLACQLCQNPIAGHADVNIHFLGLPIDELLLITLSERIAGSLTGLDTLQEPDQVSLEIHETASEKLINRNRQTRERLAREIANDINLALDSIVEQVSKCEDCQSCFASCPICTNRGFKPGSKLTRPEIAEWMISCVGCGMCEEHCEIHTPLVRVFAILKEKLEKIN